MRCKQSEDNNALYEADTDPSLSAVTAPIPGEYLPSEMPFQNSPTSLSKGMALVRKINRLLHLAAVVLSLLLFTRFLLTFFVLNSSLFSQWVFLLSMPLYEPFHHLLPLFSRGEFIIDSSVLIAILVYIVLLKLLSHLLKIIVE